jgi:hypothetical protein
MRDLLSRLDAITNETALDPKNPKADYDAKKKALYDLEMDPKVDKDAVQQRKQDLEREAKAKGVFEIGDEFGISFTEDLELVSEIVDILEDGIVIELDDYAIDVLQSNNVLMHEGEIEETEAQKGVDGKRCWKGYRRMGTKMKGGKRVDNCVKVSEGKMKDVAMDLKELSDAEFKEKYGKSKDEMKIALEGKESSARMRLMKALDDVETRKKFAKGEIRIPTPDERKEKEDKVKEAEYQGRKVPLGKPMQGDVKKFKVYVKNPKGNVVKVNFGDPNMRIKKSNPARRKSFRARHNCASPGPRHKARYWSCRKW